MLSRWNRTRKGKQKQKGGQQYFTATEDISDIAVERVFCGGKLMDKVLAPTGKSVTDEDRPLFFIKWAPMASGKSSKRVMTIIQNILQPYSLEDCADVSSDKLIENLLPFRFYTAKAKTRNLRIKADMKVLDFAHAQAVIKAIERDQTQEIQKLNEILGKLDETFRRASEKVVSFQVKKGKLLKLTPNQKEEAEKVQEKIQGIDEKLVQLQNEIKTVQRQVPNLLQIKERYLSLESMCKEFLREWNPENNKAIALFLNYILQKQVRDTYQYYYREEKNVNNKTLRDKVVDFFISAYKANINIIYETAGLGYGEKTRKLQDEVARARVSSAASEAAEAVGTVSLGRLSSADLREQIRAQIFENNFSEFLGEIQYAETFDGVTPIKIPIGIQTEGRKLQFIPEHYRIVIVFPIVPSEEIKRRGYLRAYYQLMSSKLPVYDVTSEQIDVIVDNMTELINTLFEGGDPKKKEQLPGIINTILKEELSRYSRTAIEEPIDFGKNLMKFREEAKEADEDYEAEEAKEAEEAENQNHLAVRKIAVPFFRLASVDLEKSIAQAFQYSIDYFLRQYIQIGRIEQVIFVNNN